MGRVEAGGAALAFATSAPTHFQGLEFLPARGAPVILWVTELGDLRFVQDWVVTPDGSWIVNAAAVEGVTVNGTSLPAEESLIVVASSGSVSAAPVPPRVIGKRLEVGTDGGVLFLGTVNVSAETAGLVLGRVDPSGHVVDLRAFAGSERDPLDFIGPYVALGARSDAVVVGLVATDVAAGVCHSRAVIFPARGGAPVTRDLGRGCIGMIAVTSDGALAVSGRFDRRVRFGLAAEDVAERGQTFVTVVDPGE